MSTIDPILGEEPRRPSWQVALFMGTIGMLMAQLAAGVLGFATQVALREAHVAAADDGALMIFLLQFFACITVVLPLAFIRGFSIPVMRARYGLRWGGISAATFAVAVVGMFALSAEMSALTTVLERAHALPARPRSSFTHGMVEALRFSPMSTRLILALALGIFPGLGEELLFRGQVQRGLLAHWSPLAAIVVTSAMFALAHLEPVLYLHTFAFGCWVGWIAARSDAILPGMILHALNNSTLGFAIILASVFGPRALSPLMQASSPILLALAFGELVIVALCARFLDRRLPGAFVPAAAPASI